MTRRKICSALVAVAATATLVGCGGHSPAKQAAPALVHGPETPSVHECGELAAGSGAAPSRAPSQTPPVPGRYAFRSQGVVETLRDGKVVDQRPLPGRMYMLVTASRKVGNVWCFRAQTQLSDSIADTATFALRGSELFLVEAEFQAGGDIVRYVPNPSIRSLDPRRLQWAGSFSGSTRGTYQASAVGKRSIRVGTDRVRSVGVEVRTNFTGDVRGWQTGTTWFAVDKKVPVIVDARSVRDYGVDQYRVKYHAVLLSVHPEG